MTPTGAAEGGRLLSKDLGLSHAEFFRALPKALAAYNYGMNGNLITVAYGGGRIEIRLGSEQERRMAMLRVPRTKVDFRFVDMSEDQVLEFLKRFDRSYQRGGG